MAVWSNPYLSNSLRKAWVSYLRLKNNDVHDDGDKDSLYGLSSVDWFWASDNDYASNSITGLTAFPNYLR